MQMRTAIKSFMAVAGGLALLMAFAPSLNAAHIQVSISNFAFTPHGSRIIAGDTITWTNNDNIPHSSTSDNGVWDSGILSHGQTFSFVFDNAGTFPYHCAVHLSMKDTVFVSPRTGIDESPNTPGSFELSQNYPNPFNAQTLIKYSLPQAAHVTVDIYDVLGQKVDNLTDEDQGAGDHEVIWNASSKATGVFFYRVTVDNQTKTGRMILLK
jgi:plastocyanin